ncbi:MAG: reverse transcriptase domain-containing protein [Plesiomonas shigelloides]
MNANRGLALDKFPGVRPIGIGNIERRLIAKCIIAEAGPAATQAAGTYQLAVGLPAGIEGAIHAARQYWETQADEPNFGFLQIDAKNAFNELDRTMMLYVTRYLWPKGARYVYNCYKHWSVVLFLDTTSGTATKIYSATGVVQGCPLSMYLYSLTTVPLIQRLQREFSSMLHVWYADDGNVAGPFEQIDHYLSRLTKLGKPYGYIVQPNKCQLITKHPDSARYALEDSPLATSVKIIHGSRFLGGYIGTDTTFSQWLTEKVQGWAHGVTAITTVATRYPQSAYTGFHKSLQQQWHFVQRTCPCEPAMFQPIEDLISNTFIPALFQLPSNHSSLPPRPTTALPIKKAGLALNNPTTDAPLNYKASQELTAEITRALLDPTLPPQDTTPTPTPVLPQPQLHNPPRGAFRIADHRTAMATGRENAKRAKEASNQAIYDEQSNSLMEQPNGCILQRRLARCCKTGAWLTARPGTLERTSLSAQEWRDGIYLRYGMTPQGLPALCDGCNQPNSTNHAFNCLFGGLVTLRHNDIREELGAIASEIFQPTAITIEPSLTTTPTSAIPVGQQIHNNNTTTIETNLPPETAPTANSTHERGDIAIRGLFERGTNAIIDVKIANLDSISYRSQDPEKVLHNQEKLKQQKYKSICETRRESFHPFVASSDGMLAPEATKILQHLAGITAHKQQKPYSAIVNHLRLRISITLVKAAHHCLRGSRKRRHNTIQPPTHTEPTEPSPDFRMIHG